MDEIKRYNNLETQTIDGEWVKHSDHEAAIKAAVAAEREACALICDSVDNYSNPMTATDCADAIRARGAAHD